MPSSIRFKRLIDLVKRVLFLREQAEREIAIVGVAAGVGLVHAEGGGFAAFRAGAEIVLRHAGHGIDHGVAQMQQLFALAVGKRIELSLLVIVPENRLRGGEVACRVSRGR